MENRSGLADGSSTICAKIHRSGPPPAADAPTKGAACSGCPCRMDFSRADAMLIAGSGRATSMSFFSVLHWVSTFSKSSDSRETPHPLLSARHTQTPVDEILAYAELLGQ